MAVDPSSFDLFLLPLFILGMPLLHQAYLAPIHLHLQTLNLILFFFFLLPIVLRLILLGEIILIFFLSGSVFLGCVSTSVCLLSQVVLNNIQNIEYNMVFLF